MDGLSARFFFTPRGWLVAYIHDTRHTDFCNAKTHTDHSGLPECNRFLSSSTACTKPSLGVPISHVCLLALVQWQTSLLALLQHPSLVSGQDIYFAVACLHAHTKVRA